MAKANRSDPTPVQFPPSGQRVGDGTATIEVPADPYPVAPSATLAQSDADDLRGAGDAFRRGDTAPMMVYLEKRRFPVAPLLDLAAEALRQHAISSRLIFDDPGPTQDLEIQLALLGRSRPTSVEECERVSGKIIELQAAIDRNTSRHALAKTARGVVASIEKWFPELFPPPATPWGPEWGATLPEPILAIRRKLPYGDNSATWLDLQPPQPVRPRRKLRAAGVFQVNPQR